MSRVFCFSQMARELGWGQKMTHISCNHNCAACCYNAPTITSWDTTTSNIVHYYLNVSPKLPLLNVTTLSFWFSWVHPRQLCQLFIGSWCHILKVNKSHCPQGKSPRLDHFPMSHLRPLPVWSPRSFLFLGSNDLIRKVRTMGVITFMKK